MGKTEDFQTVKVAAGNGRKPGIWVFGFSVFRGEIGGEENWFLETQKPNGFKERVLRRVGFQKPKNA